LVWALGAEPGDLDPLLARNSSAQVVTRQIYEPLVEQLAGPFDDTSRVPGLALAVRPSSDETVWRVRLRPGIRFQDGSAFNASAVLANVDRWQAVAAGRELLPTLFDADAPRPDLVRFILTRPDPHFDRRLESPRLGIVTPRALRAGGGSAELDSGLDTGTGAFELRERDRTRLLLARNTAWWGTGRDLGPALDQVEFRIVPNADERIELLRAGDAQVAGDLDSLAVRKVNADPLLTALPAGPGGLGIERSVRGIDSARVTPSLSGTWLTTIGPG
jgi:ABC-type transport system substrate-binding protein